MKKKFINELGNEIIVEVCRKDGKINLSIKGPKSHSGWIITSKEFEVLLELMKSLEKP